MNTPAIPRPVLLLVSAPSGAGKTTLCKRLLADTPSMRYSVSCTTRAPREGEVDGVDYVFLTRAQFEAEIATGAFLEYAEVYGNYYGTRISAVADALRAGESILLDVDVQGAELIRAALRRENVDPLLRDSYCDIFIHPPSLDVLRTRIEGRGKDSPDVIERRLRHAAEEMEESGLYQFQLVNSDLEKAYAVLRSVSLAAAHRSPPKKVGI